jgi:hypothetical protein
MPRKLTNAEIDLRLDGRNIRRSDDYIDSNTKIRWQCMIEDCGHIWLATPGAVIHQTGCPKCNKRLKITNELVDERLSQVPIIRTTNVMGNNKTSCIWQCIKPDCLYKWSARIDMIINFRTGCPKCAGNIPLTNDIIDQRLQSRNIKRMSDYSGSINNHMSFLCLVEGCYCEWAASLTNVLNDENGCPDCKRGKSEK